MEVKLTQEEAKNVLAFLARTQLSGQEAPILVALATKIQEQIVVEKEKKEDEPKGKTTN